MRLGWGHDDGAFFFSRPDAAQQECCEPGFTLLCMGLFSRFCVQALPCTPEGTICRVRDTKSLVPRAYGIQFQHVMLWSVFKRKPAPDLIRGGDRFASRKRVRSRIQGPVSILSKRDLVELLVSDVTVSD